MFSWCHLSELLENANHHPSVLWSYQFMEEESVKKSWEESYERSSGKYLAVRTILKD